MRLPPVGGVVAGAEGEHLVVVRLLLLVQRVGPGHIHRISQGLVFINRAVDGISWNFTVPTSYKLQGSSTVRRSYTRDILKAL